MPSIERCHCQNGTLLPWPTFWRSKIQIKTFPQWRVNFQVWRLCTAVHIWSSPLAKYRLTHSGELPFNCDKCEYCCTQRSFLARHTLTHSSKTPNQVRWVCVEVWWRRYLQLNKLPANSSQACSPSTDCFYLTVPFV